MAGRQKARIGRPPLPPQEKKLPSMGFRPTPALRAELEKDARTNGRSVAKEIESQLERASLNNKMMGGSKLFTLFRMLGAAANFIEAETGRAWSNDWETFLPINAAWDTLIASARPSPKKDWTDRVEAMETEWHAVEVPQRPPMPVWPGHTGPGMLARRTDDEIREFDEAMSEYQTRMKKWQREMTAYDRKREAYSRWLLEQRDHFEALTKMGKRVAEGFLRPEGKR